MVPPQWGVRCDLATLTTVCFISQTPRGQAAQSDRIKFVDFQLQGIENDRCSARVVLGWGGDDQFIGEAEGGNLPEEALHCAAEATVNALRLSVGGSLAVELQGVKMIEAYDTVVVMAWIFCRINDRPLRLVGSQIIQDNPSRWERVSGAQVIEEKE